MNDHIKNNAMRDLMLSLPRRSSYTVEEMTKVIARFADADLRRGDAVKLLMDIVDEINASPNRGDVTKVVISAQTQARLAVFGLSEVSREEEMDG